jgi:hypothetical protein
MMRRRGRKRKAAIVAKIFNAKTSKPLKLSEGGFGVRTRIGVFDHNQLVARKAEIIPTMWMVSHRAEGKVK